MAKSNVKTRERVYTHEGARAYKVGAEQELRRSVMACLLWEGTFYESGQSIADRIASLVGQVPAQVAANIAIEARTKQNLRHVPLWIVVNMIEQKYADPKDRLIVGRLIPEVVLRADEMGELVALYWKDGKKPLPRQLKIGLANAFKKFDEHRLAKYDRDVAVKIRDVMFLCHPKPEDEAQEALFKKVASRTLQTPDTWEVALSGGADKKEAFERLMAEGKLGYMALLRNLRNMKEAGVAKSTVREALVARKGADKVLPFRFLAAANEVPGWEDVIDDAFLAHLGQMPKLGGKTVVVVDVSGSMYSVRLSANSKMNRAQAACALAAVARELCEEPVIYATAGNDATRVHRTQEAPARRGMALIEAVYGLCRPLGGGGIFLTPVMRFLEEKEKTADRIIVITDEQDCAVADKDRPTLAKPFGRFNYLINVNTDKNGIGYGAWCHIDGWSESVLDFIKAHEGQQA